MRGFLAVLAVATLAACAESREVRITFRDPGVLDAAVRIELQIARAPANGCVEVIWEAPLSADLGPTATFVLERATSMPMQVATASFGGDVELVVVARAFDSFCRVIGVGCRTARAGSDGPLVVDIESEFVDALPCIGVCEAGACLPDRCEGEAGLCSDGNTADGDGCSSACEVERGHRCPPGGTCAAYASCAEYFDDGFSVTGLYLLPDHGHVICDHDLPPGGWTFVGAAFSGVVAVEEWTSGTAIESSEIFLAGRFGAGRSFLMSDAAIASIQGSAPRAALLGFTPLDAEPVTRATAAGCLYRHSAPAAGACGTLVAFVGDPTPPPPADPFPNTLGMGNAPAASHDPLVGFRVPAGLAGAPCDGRDDGCGVDLLVR